MKALLCISVILTTAVVIVTLQPSVASLHFVLIVGLLCVGCAPLQRKYVRARWANCLFVGIGVFGPAAHLVSLLLGMNWLVLSSRADEIVHLYLPRIDGLILGWLLALLISGQVFGTKQVNEGGSHGKHAA